MPLRHFIEIAVQIFRSHPDASDQELLQFALASGIDRPLAVQLLSLLPIAYGRVMLAEDGLKFSDEYICRGDLGKRDRPGRLDALPVWTEAVNFAKQDGQPFFPIASRSPEILAADAALKDGQKLQDLYWSPPVFLWEVDAFPSPLAKKSPGWLPVTLLGHTRNEKRIEIIATIVAVLIGLAAVGAVVYYTLPLLRSPH